MSTSERMRPSCWRQRRLAKAGPRAHSILTTCQRHGVALHIDPDGALVIGKAGAKADDATQPWRTLIMAIEAHTDAVARLWQGAKSLVPKAEASSLTAGGVCNRSNPSRLAGGSLASR